MYGITTYKQQTIDEHILTSEKTVTCQRLVYIQELGGAETSDPLEETFGGSSPHSGYQEEHVGLRSIGFHAEEIGVVVQANVDEHFELHVADVRLERGSNLADSLALFF